MTKKIRLIDDIKQQNRRPNGPLCTVGVAISKLEGEDRNDMITALADRTITARAIMTALANREIVLTMNPTIRHRRGECACES